MDGYGKADAIPSCEHGKGSSKLFGHLRGFATGGLQDHRSAKSELVDARISGEILLLGESSEEFE